jgi:hypothetical protein
MGSLPFVFFGWGLFRAFFGFGEVPRGGERGNGVGWEAGGEGRTRILGGSSSADGSRVRSFSRSMIGKSSRLPGWANLLATGSTFGEPGPSSLSLSLSLSWRVTRECRGTPERPFAFSSLSHPSSFRLRPVPPPPSPISPPPPDETKKKTTFPSIPRQDIRVRKRRLPRRRLLRRQGLQGRRQRRLRTRR